MKKYLQRVMDMWTASGGAIFTFSGPIVALILFMWRPTEKHLDKGLTAEGEAKIWLVLGFVIFIDGILNLSAAWVFQVPILSYVVNSIWTIVGILVMWFMGLRHISYVDQKPNEVMK